MQTISNSGDLNPSMAEKKKFSKQVEKFDTYLTKNNIKYVILNFFLMNVQFAKICMTQ